MNKTDVGMIDIFKEFSLLGFDMKNLMADHKSWNYRNKPKRKKRYYQGLVPILETQEEKEQYGAEKFNIVDADFILQKNGNQGQIMVLFRYWRNLGVPCIEFYSWYGEMHREDGPAFLISDGRDVAKNYYIFGHEVAKAEINRHVAKKRIYKIVS